MFIGPIAYGAGFRWAIVFIFISSSPAHETRHGLTGSEGTKSGVSASKVGSQQTHKTFVALNLFYH